MVGKTDYSSVPTSAELGNNKHNKYTINKDYNEGFLIPKSLCALIGIGAILLALITGLLVFFLVPRCDKPTNLRVQALTKDHSATTTDHSTTDKDHSTTTIPSAMAIKEDYLYIVLPKEFRTVEKNERLPRSLRPLRYRLQIIPFLENATTSATEKIDMLVNENTKQIIFNVKDLKIDAETVTVTNEDENQPKIQVIGQKYLDGERYLIEVDTELEKDQIYHLSFGFSGKLSSDLSGLYRSQYEDVTTKKIKYLATTQFSPNDARRAFPCFDEPEFKANFSIIIGRQTHMMALSNMPLAGPPQKFIGEEGWWWDEFEETPEIPTYLVAFIVSELKSHSNKTDFIKIWAKDDSVFHSEYAKIITPNLLQFFENYTGVKLTSLPKLDVVAVPDFGFHAMENWGLLTFRESSLLYDVYHSNWDNARDIAVIMSHEIAHQWFGNLVTPKWWNDLWLKEGFSTYLQYFGVHKLDDHWNILDEFIPYEIKSAYEIDSLESAKPLSAEIINNKQVREAFNKLPYSKGACIIKMMHNFLGDDVFKVGLNSFLNKYQYGNADKYDLYETFSETALNSTTANDLLDYQSDSPSIRTPLIMDNETLKNIMDSWTLQPGFPIVTVKSNKTNDIWELTLHQRRFLMPNKKNQATWWIPISMATDLNDKLDDTTPAFWMENEPEITISISANKWYLLNLYYTGYFIVNYDEENWKTLLLPEVLMRLPTVIRAQLISDSMTLSKAGLLDYHIPLTMIANMALNDAEIMFVPTLVAFEKLQYLYDMLYSTPAFGDFETYHNVIFKKTYDKVDFKAVNVNEYLTQRILKMVSEWSCRNSESKCARESIELFQGLISRRVAVPSNIRPIVYCTAIRFGGVAEWRTAYSYYLQTRTPSEKNILLDALGCTNHRWLLSSYLDLLLMPNSSIRTQDAVRVFLAVANNQNGYRIAFDYLRENWVNLVKEFGDGGFNLLSQMVERISRFMNTEYQLVELIEFRKSIDKNISIVELTFDEAIEQVRVNVQWMKRNYKAVEDWLKAHHKHFRL